MWKARAAFFLALLLPAAVPASAQMLGPLISQMAGPFAGRIGAFGPENLAPYGSPAGATPHLLQGTQALMSPSANNPAPSAGQPAGPQPGRPEMGTSSGAGAKRPTGGKGEKKGTDAPDADVGESLFRVLVGACAGGAFIGGFAAVTAAPAAAPAAAVVAAPAALTTFFSAVGVGCLLGGATAATSLGAVWAYRALGGP